MKIKSIIKFLIKSLIKLAIIAEIIERDLVILLSLI